MKVLLAFAAVYLIWGSTYLAIRVALESMPPFFFAGARFLLAGLLCSTWLAWRGEFRAGPEPTSGPPTLVHWRSACVVGALLLVAANGGVCWAEQFVPSGFVGLLIGVAPLNFALMGWLLFREPRPTLLAALGIALGFAGVSILFAPGALGAGARVDWTGAGVVLGGNLCWVLGSLLTRRLPLPRSPFVATAIEMTAGGILLLLVSALLGEFGAVQPARWTARSLLAWGYLVLFGSIVALTAYVWLLSHVSPVRVATYAYVNPIVAILLGSLLAGEPFTPRIAIAAVVIVVGVALVLASQSKRMAAGS